jgi:hypothetical protein
VKEQVIFFPNKTGARGQLKSQQNVSLDVSPTPNKTLGKSIFPQKNQSQITVSDIKLNAI